METKGIPSRPYSRLRGSEVSITTAIGVLDKPGLPWGSAKETAMKAVFDRESWQGMEPMAAVDMLRKWHKGVWTNRAEMGTLVHAVNEEWIHGRTIDLVSMVKAVPSWEHQIDEKIAEADKFVSALEAFWADFRPQDNMTEQIVRTPGAFVGTGDWWTSLSGVRWYLDIKSSAQTEADKGVYGDSWSLQCAAIRHAREHIEYVRDEKGKLAVGSVESNYEVDRTGVVLLRADGTYQLFELDSGPDVFDAFMQCVHLHQWRKNIPNPKVVLP